MSLRASKCPTSPCACSGGVQPGVPRTVATRRWRVPVRSGISVASRRCWTVLLEKNLIFVSLPNAAGSAVKFFLAATEFAQPLERDSAEFAARTGQRVGEVARGNCIFLCKLLVRDLVMAFEVVGLKLSERAPCRTEATPRRDILSRLRSHFLSKNSSRDSGEGILAGSIYRAA